MKLGDKKALVMAPKIKGSIVGAYSLEHIRNDPSGKYKNLINSIQKAKQEEAEEGNHKQLAALEFVKDKIETIKELDEVRAKEFARVRQNISDGKGLPAYANISDDLKNNRFQKSKRNSKLGKQFVPPLPKEKTFVPPLPKEPVDKSKTFVPPLPKSEPPTPREVDSVPIPVVVTVGADGRITRPSTREHELCPDPYANPQKTMYESAHARRRYQGSCFLLNYYDFVTFNILRFISFSSCLSFFNKKKTGPRTIVIRSACPNLKHVTPTPPSSALHRHRRRCKIIVFLTNSSTAMTLSRSLRRLPAPSQ